MYRNVALYIVLTVITCGLFGLYWLVVLADDMNRLANDGDNMDGILVLLLSIVTCGIYGFYWAYKQGVRVDRMNGNPNGSTGILYLIVGLVGFNIIVYALLQNEINQKVNTVQ